MTKESQVIEGNKLIAEFMGKEILYYSGQSDMIDIGKKIIPLNEWAKYHSSWDWLMPVVKKINDIKGYDVVIWKYYCHINDETQILFENGNPDVKKAVWQSVVQFIQWYNQKHQP